MNDKQRAAARATFDPDHTLTDDELEETAGDALRLAATELRRLADIADVLPVGFQMLRNRADELDPK